VRASPPAGGPSFRLSPSPKTPAPCRPPSAPGSRSWSGSSWFRLRSRW